MPLKLLRKDIPFEVDNIAYYDAYLTGVKAQLKKDNELLRGLLDHYLSLVNSGDAGFWNPETEDIVIECRQALQGER